MFFVDFKKTVFSPIFASCVLCYTIVMLIGNQPGFRFVEEGFFYKFMESFFYGLGEIFLPVIASVPFLSWYMDEQEQGIRYQNLIRTNVLQYAVSKVVVAIVSGLLLIGLGLLFYFLFWICRGATLGEGIPYMFDGTVMEEYMTKGQVIIPFLIYVGSVLLSSMIWPALSLVCSVFTSNKYVVLVFPSLFFWIMNFVGLVTGCWYISPTMVTLTGVATMTSPDYGIIFSIAYTLVMVLLSASVYVGRVRRLNI